MSKNLIAAALGFCIALTAKAALADCQGEGYFETLRPEIRKSMIEASNRHDFHTVLIFQADKGEETYYIIATNAYDDPRNDLLWPEINAIFDLSKAITFSNEYPYEESLQRFAQDNLDKVARTSRPFTNELLPAEIWRLLLEAGQKRGSGSLDLMAARPSLILESLALGPCRSGSAQEKGLTGQIWQEAQKRGFDIAYLQSWASYFTRYDLFTEAELMDRISVSLVHDKYADRYEVSYANLYYQGKLGLMIDMERQIWHDKYSMQQTIMAKPLPQGRFEADFDRLEEFKFKEQSLLWPLILADQTKQWPHILVVNPENLPGRNGLLFAMKMQGFDIRPIR